MNLTIQIVGWNSEGSLKRLLPLLQKLDAAIPVRYIDNASSDDSVAVVKQFLPRADIITVSENTGFCSGHNIGFAACDTEFVLVLNPDVEIVWEQVQKLLPLFQDKTIAAVQGKLMRNAVGILDSTGVVQTITLNGKERGAGEKDTGQYNQPAHVAATTGACSIYRTSALRRVAHGTYTTAGHSALEVFDKDFFAYKEDVDLGWRLRNAGFTNQYLPVRVGTHPRAMRTIGRAGWGIIPSHIVDRLRNVTTRWSLRNYVWMIVKNASAKKIFLHEIFIDARLGVFILLSLVYWPLLSVWLDIFQKLPLMMEKRYEARHYHR
ncbi:MAG: glycosyltransferase [Candidatus Andersenbacteria bacterium]|nr:glycosyltransferase [Candidatus Andersenbacteria bacterium]MBI3250300.1 glycosyltransferase [Candidatus Andersenbacteria bacterium]